MLGGDLPVACPAYPLQTRNVSRRFATTVTGAADQRHLENTSIAADLTRDDRYRHTTEV